MHLRAQVTVTAMEVVGGDQAVGVDLLHSVGAQPRIDHLVFKEFDDVGDSGLMA
ncbi:Uncharacterised protein [Mycobacteroides abscessus subsp. abscessus]|nr:Uncharacterised protein [Mycobacteroides abscessus subsp. abscessus]SKW97060.1 Uncharacterised protein [Mycobacteroides abscessus subsp. abscessus]